MKQILLIGFVGFDEITALLQQINQQPITQIQPISKRGISESDIWQKITESIRSCELTGHRMFVLTGYTNEQVNLPAWIDSNSELIKSLKTPQTYVVQDGILIYLTIVLKSLEVSCGASWRKNIKFLIFIVMVL